MEEYFTKLSLAKLGYRFDGDSLDDVTASAFFIIDMELKKLDNKRAQKTGQRRGR